MQNDLNLSNKDSAIVLLDVRKSYPNEGKLALRDVSLTVKEGEFLCIVGPSGCGKSTVLKIIAGLEHADRGEVHVPTQLSMVFQSGALLPWLTVADNIALVLKAQKKDGKAIAHATKQYLGMVGLGEFAGKYPRELSGGQRQRVGIARALSVEPHVLLLDEPFSALDPQTTEGLHHDLCTIWEQTHITIVMVSHSIEEAVSLADRIVLMKDGGIEEIFPVQLPHPRHEQGLAFHEMVQKVRKKFFAQ